MTLAQALKCPACGASPVHDEASTQPLRCSYCGTQLILTPPAVRTRAEDPPAPVARDDEPETFPFDPQMVVPFRISEHEGWEHLVRTVLAAKWAPSDFAKTGRRISAERRFLPYWVVGGPLATRPDLKEAWDSPYWYDGTDIEYPLDQAVEYTAAAVAGATVVPCTVDVDEHVSNNAWRVLLPVWWIRWEHASWKSEAIVNGVTGRTAVVAPLGTLPALLIWGLCIGLLTYFGLRCIGV